MLKINTGLVPEWFTPSGQEDSESPARFKLKPMDGMQFVDFCSEAKILPNGGMVPTRKGSEIAFKACLIDWENFVDQNEKPIKFSPHNFKLIPAEIISEIVGEITSRASMSEDDEKNS